MSKGASSEGTAHANNISIIAAKMVRDLLPCSTPLMQPQPCEWAAAKDKKSNRTYYYNVKTRETTWEKPIALAASQQEKDEMTRKKKESAAFFRDIEINIKNKVYNKQLQPYSQHQEQQYQLQRHVHQQHQSQHKTSTMAKTDPSANYSYITNSDIHPSHAPDQCMPPMNAYDYNVASRCEPALVKFTSNAQEEFLQQRETPLTWYSKRAGTYDRNNQGSPEKIIRTSSNTEFSSSHNQSPLPKPESVMCSSLCLAGSVLSDSVLRANVSPTPSSSSILRDRLKRRNSTGTMHVNTTIMSPDADATISCVSMILREYMTYAAVHMPTAADDDDDTQNNSTSVSGGASDSVAYDIWTASASASGYSVLRGDSSARQKSATASIQQYEAFFDSASSMYVSSSQLKGATTTTSDLNMVPSLSTIKDFFRLVYTKSQLESECVLVAYIYIDRFLRCTQGAFTLKYNNWRAVLFTCLILASKVWDDMSMWNVDFAQVSTSFDLRRLNALEVQTLSALRYSLKVSAGEYARYYFHIRHLHLMLAMSSDIDTDTPDNKDSRGDRGRNSAGTAAAFTASNPAAVAGTVTIGATKSIASSVKKAQRSKTFDNLSSLCAMKSVMSIDSLCLYDAAAPANSNGSGNKNSDTGDGCIYDSSSGDASISQQQTLVAAEGVDACQPYSIHHADGR